MDLHANLSFSDYIQKCRALIGARRQDLRNTKEKEKIIEANSPFEFYPTNNSTHKKIRCGVLLLHGLLDSPFTLRDLGKYLQQQGALCRSVLLPGHGTHPQDLFSCTHQEWIATMQYGIQSLQQEVEKVYVLGYSTGGTLAAFQALTAPKSLHGIILISPAIRLKKIIECAVRVHNGRQKLRGSVIDLLSQEAEIDYAKYQSIPQQAVKEVITLAEQVRELNAQSACTVPLLMIMSKNDETTCSIAAQKFFTQTELKENKFIWYSAQSENFSDSRIITRSTHYPQWNIDTFSHIALPFSPTNTYYGMEGEFIYASHPEKNIRYGAYNHLEVKIYDLLFKLKMIKQKRRCLTFNPDFHFMAETIRAMIIDQ